MPKRNWHKHLIPVLCLLLPLFFCGCSRDELCGTWDRGGELYRFCSDGRLIFAGKSLRFERDGDDLLIYRFGEDEPPFRCSVEIKSESGILYLNGLPYYRAERGA